MSLVTVESTRLRGWRLVWYTVLEIIFFPRVPFGSPSEGER